MSYRFLLTILIMLAWGVPVEAVTANLAPGRLLGKLQLDVIPPGGGSSLPLRLVNRLEKGSRLRYQPGSIAKEYRKKGKIALVLVPAATEAKEELHVLSPQPLGKTCEWAVPYAVSIVAVVVGPTGLDQKKVNGLLEQNRDLVPSLARYAEQTGQLEGLLDVLSNWQQNSRTHQDLGAVLSGFAARNALSVPRLDSTAPSEEQAALLLRTLIPALSSYDPLTSERTAAIQQSTGLAAAVAGMFFGAPVGLVAGGAALFQNFRSILFPDCEFRSALAQGDPGQQLALYARPESSKSRTRLAYLWATRVPDQDAPAVAFVSSTVHLPLGLTSLVKIAGSPADLRLLSRTRGWDLVSEAGEERIPCKVEFPSGPQLGAIRIHLCSEHLSAGSYRLEGHWDWDTFQVSGTVQVHPLGDTANAFVSPASCDRFVEGSGVVKVELEGADFQFLESVRLQKPDKPVELSFHLPLGKRAGVQKQVEVEIDTNSIRAGEHSLLLVQSGDHSSAVTIRMHLPHPIIANLPILLNVGEAMQQRELRGTGLDRITGLQTGTARWSLLPPSKDGTRREVSVETLQEAPKGSLLDLKMQVKDLNEPLVIPHAVKVRGPRPRIVNVERSAPNDGTVVLRKGEVAAGAVVSYVVRVENVESMPVVELRCGENGRPLSLRPGEQQGQAKVEAAGDQMLYLALDPAGFGEAGCRLEARVSTEATGTSDPFALGVVVKTPRIDSFSLTDEQAGEGFYAGTLVGEDLQLIQKVGWDSERGYPIHAIPAPIGADFRKQSLRISLPWPAPSPHAPVYIWLRGENEARSTRVGF